MVGRIPILDVSPVVDCGRHRAKAVVGETFPVTATAFRDGHGAIGVEAVLIDPNGEARPPVRMRTYGDQRWTADVRPDAPGDWTFNVAAWADPYESWRQAAEVKVAAGVDVELMAVEGALVLDRAASVLAEESVTERRLLGSAAAALRDPARPVPARLATATAPDVRETLARHPLRDLVTCEGPFPLLVERERALVGAWYEFFPRSQGARYNEASGQWTSGTLRTAAERLPDVAAMGFDVVYLPPIHPIGRVNRKGPNNALRASPEDPGSPWAIGSRAGGHDAIHPDLGDADDFAAFVSRAGQLGLEVALDFALQCAPDHPWVSEHPQWFGTRADGSIAYAENPPKKYQDIYPLDFDNDPDGIYAEVLRVLRVWMGRGVRIFRVDNPHTKPVAFWERLLADVRNTDPDVVFLAEAFTVAPMMRALAAVGFQQSYTYFTWQNSKPDLERFLVETSRQTSHVMRPNLFVNTPDILTDYLQHGGPAAFKVRAALAATASPTWGVYSGFELYEHVAVRPGSEEYLHSEKYEYRPRDWAAAEREGRSLAPYLRRLNEIRAAHPALRRLRNLTVHHVPDPAMLAFSKREALPGGGDDVVLVVANLDTTTARESVVELDLAALGLPESATFGVHDEISGERWRWQQRNYVRLDPADEPVHILHVQDRP
jgi:starch synthase (maltosyl-transferring)